MVEFASGWAEGTGNQRDGGRHAAALLRNATPPLLCRRVGVYNCCSIQLLLAVRTYEFAAEFWLNFNLLQQQRYKVNIPNFFDTAKLETNNTAAACCAAAATVVAVVVDGRNAIAGGDWEKRCGYRS